MKNKGLLKIKKKKKKMEESSEELWHFEDEFVESS